MRSRVVNTIKKYVMQKPYTSHSSEYENYKVMDRAVSVIIEELRAKLVNEGI